MKPLILLTDPIDQAAVQHLNSAEVMILPDMTPGTYRPLMRKAHILVVRSGFPIPENILDDAPNLIGVMRHGAGVDVIPMATANRLLVPVANVPGGSAQSVAELGLIFMGMLSRHVRELDNTLRSRGWARAQQLSTGGNNLSGKTVGIIGVGAIGSRLAKICHGGLDMAVLGHQRHTENLPEFVRPADPDTLFSKSDFVVLTCPLTDQTRHICSASRFKMMKDSAFVINLGRGALVRTQALIDAIENNQIAGAGLDVFEEEPLPADHPLITSRRVILTPHIGARTRQSSAYNADITVRQTLEILEGRMPKYIVNPQVWEAGAERRNRILAMLAEN